MSRQIIPFPLPIYLATYFGNRLGASGDSLSDGSFKDPFPVSAHTDYGNFILRNLSSAPRPHKYQGNYTFFISVSNWAGDHNQEVIRAQRAFVGLSQKSTKIIIDKFNAIFRAHLITFVRGAESVTNSKAENKRVRTLAIRNFCEENQVIYSDKNLVAWKKACQRQKKTPKTLIYSTL